jgi:hypothetical protein
MAFGPPPFKEKHSFLRHVGVEKRRTGCSASLDALYKHLPHNRLFFPG